MTKVATSIQDGVGTIGEAAKEVATTRWGNRLLILFGYICGGNYVGDPQAGKFRPNCGEGAPSGRLPMAASHWPAAQWPAAHWPPTTNRVVTADSCGKPFTTSRLLVAAS